MVTGFWGQKLVVHFAKFGVIKLKTSKPLAMPQNKAQKLVYRVKNPISIQDDKSQEKAQETSRNQNSNFQIFRGAGKATTHLYNQQFTIQPAGNRRLFRSAVAKIRKLVSPKYLETVFKKENCHIDHIKAIGGRYVIITFPNSEFKGWHYNGGLVENLVRGT